MDLGAYAQINELEQIAKENGIEVPRLRGYRIMKNEEPVSKEHINEMKRNCEISVVKDLCEATPFWNSNPQYWTMDTYTDYLKQYFLTVEKDEDGRLEYTGIRWDRIHGWKRKVLKFEIKKQKRRIQQQYDMWNKYAGKEGILYIHSRIGGNNWKCYDGKAELISQPWFLDRVDDCFDSTYCDFYARIGSNGERNKNEYI